VNKSNKTVTGGTSHVNTSIAHCRYLSSQRSQRNGTSDSRSEASSDAKCTATSLQASEEHHCHSFI